MGGYPSYYSYHNYMPWYRRVFNPYPYGGAPNEYAYRGSYAAYPGGSFASPPLFDNYSAYRRSVPTWRSSYAASPYAFPPGNAYSSYAF